MYNVYMTCHKADRAQSIQLETEYNSLHMYKKYIYECTYSLKKIYHH